MAKEILIADDDSALCRLLTMHCRHMGLSVRMAHDAMHALLLIHKQKPDLVLLDISMPAGNGISVCEMLSSDPRLNSIPVIIMSGTQDEQVIQRAESLGAIFVHKHTDFWQSLKPEICKVLRLDPSTPKKCA